MNLDDYRASMEAAEQAQIARWAAHGRCPAIVPNRYGPPHRCEAKSSRPGGFCGTHWALDKRQRNQERLAWEREVKRATLDRRRIPWAAAMTLAAIL